MLKVHVSPIAKPCKSLGWNSPVELFLPKDSFDLQVYWTTIINPIALGACMRLYKYSKSRAMHFFLACILFLSANNWVFAANCFKQAAQRYAVPVQLLQAIALQESSGNPRAINRNRNGSYDIGLMQINSAWLPTLAKHGISAEHLWDPCVSTLVGAWILSNNFARLGFNTQGLGAYNAASPHKREIYARQVLRRLTPVAPHPKQAVLVAPLH